MLHVLLFCNCLLTLLDYKLIESRDCVLFNVSARLLVPSNYVLSISIYWINKDAMSFRAGLVGLQLWEEQLSRRVLEFKLQRYSSGDWQTRVGLSKWLLTWSGSEDHWGREYEGTMTQHIRRVALMLPRRSQAQGRVEKEAVNHVLKSFHRWCDWGREVPSSCGPASVEQRKGNESDGRFTQDQH